MPRRVGALVFGWLQRFAEGGSFGMHHMVHGFATALRSARLCGILSVTRQYSQWITECVSLLAIEGRVVAGFASSSRPACCRQD